jgi:exosortase/archaeosortase family protein
MRRAACNPRVRFVWRFAVLAGVLLSLYYFPYERGAANALLNKYLSLYAHLAGAAIRLFDPDVRVFGTRIDGRMNLVFALNCDAMDVFILFGAAVLAYPSAWTKRVVGLAAGWATVVFVNVARIVSLYFIGANFPSAFDLFHLQLWPLTIVVLATSGFLVWVRNAAWMEADSHGSAPAQA